MFDLISQNLGAIQDAGKALAGAAGLWLLQALGTAANKLRGRIAARRERKRTERDHEKDALIAESRWRAEWYTSVYRRLCCPSYKTDPLSEEALHNLSVQQVCAHLGTDLPVWAVNGWERARVGKLNETPALKG